MILKFGIASGSQAESATSGKTGGLRQREPLKAHQFQLFEAVVFFFLVLNILTHDRLVLADH